MNARLLVPIGVTLMIVLLAIAYAAGTRSASAPPPQANTVSAAERAANAQETARLNQPQAPVPRATPVVARADPPPLPTDAEIAAGLSRMEGEQLIGALYLIDQSATNQPTFAQLERGATRYAGQTAVLTGEVLEIQDIGDTDGTFLRLAIGGDSERVIAVFTFVHPADDIVRGRNVRVYGSLAGSFSYQSQANWQITIPRLNAVAVVRANVPRRASR